MRKRTRGVILPVVLFVLLLIGLLGAMFSFRINADLASTQAGALRMQTRLAAEAGVEHVKLLLRTARFDVNRWYHNPDELHRIIVWVDGADRLRVGTNEEFKDAMGFRFSIVADDPTDHEKYIRFGITDEASKLNLNTATEEQLLILVRHALAGDQETDPQLIVDAILDWRDTDSTPRGEAGDTEGEYYARLAVPYRVKNGPFDTVEELLLVKGVTPALLYGEDRDRNGLLTPNEDDGDRSYPPDNQDNVLDRGLFPYLTVLSYENNTANDNRQRVHLQGDEGVLRAELELAFEDRTVIDYIVGATRPPAPPAQQPGGRQGGAQSPRPQQPGGRGGARNPAGNNPQPPKPGPQKSAPGDGQLPDDPPIDESGDEQENDPPADPGAEEGEESPPPQSPPQTPAKLTSPASLLLDRTVEGEVVRSPLGPEHLAVLMDRFTVHPPDKRRLDGLINVNTATATVLRCLPGLSDEQVAAILETRGTLNAESKATTAWLMTSDVLDLETFERIAPLITARAQQFKIESLGYADHLGMVTRLEVVVDIVGPVMQTVYYRDITAIGGHFPIREEDRENIRVH